jgi:hypothetical protein
LKRVLLLQLDGKLPNLALMRIASFCRGRGDEVELRQVRSPKAIEKGLWDDFDEVYGSLIFERTRPVARRAKEIYPNIVLGGTGWDYTTSLESIGVDPSTAPDYSDYPNFRHSMGFTQRGCRLSCEFCVVPKKEGKVKEMGTIAEIWRGEGFPKEVLLLDNDFFGQPNWRERIREIREGDFKVSFNQGVNCRMISDEAAEAIASVKYRDDSMKRPRLYTAWDNKADEDVLFRGLNRLVKAGVRPDNIMVYMLIGFWAGENDRDWLYRVDRLQDFGCRPYPMPYVRNEMTRGFQRWLIRLGSFKVSWEEYKLANCRPEKLKHHDRTSLFVTG